jgi:hypothetical protein
MELERFRKVILEAAGLPLEEISAPNKLLQQVSLQPTLHPMLFTGWGTSSKFITVYAVLLQGSHAVRLTRCSASSCAIHRRWA